MTRSEYLLVAPEGEGMRRSELEARLTAIREGSPDRIALLSLEPDPHDAAPEEEVNAISLTFEAGDPASTADRNARAAAVAKRLGWDLLEPVPDGAPGTDQVERIRALARRALEDGRPAAPDHWLSSAFQQPAWVLALLAMVSFGAAAALLLFLDVEEKHFAGLAGLIGAALLVVLLWLTGAWRARS